MGPADRTEPIDFSRHRGLLNHLLMAQTHLAVVGCGGSAGMVEDLARCAIGQWTLVDSDSVAVTNVATQGVYVAADVGRSKVAALADRVIAINPAARVTHIGKRYQELSGQEHAHLWSADLVLAMTDDFATQSMINRHAIAAGTDVVFAICYLRCEAVEVTATFADAIAGGRGCHRCHTKARYDAYATGFRNPGLIGSYPLAASYLNALIGLIVLGRLHERAGASLLPVSEIAREFARRPCLISRIVPSFGADPGDAFAGLPAEPFTTRLFALDTPTNWRCPDCGTPGVVAQHSPTSHARMADGGRVQQEELDQ